MGPLRVALFADAYHEANGVARVAQDFEAYAARHGLPFLCVCAGPTTQVVPQGLGLRLELRRSSLAVRLEHDLAYDPLLWRHAGRVSDALRAFRADVLHITGPSDIGQLGAWLGHRLSIPIVGSWHTNVHEYAGLRAGRWLGWLPAAIRRRVQREIERRVLDAAVLFYRVPRLLLAPNPDLVDLLARRTQRPTRLMRHGVDLEMFAPKKRRRSLPQAFQIGFVGRLSPEKQVRALAALECALMAAGERTFEFIVVGDGVERAWLSEHMTRVTFCGVQRGAELAQTVANMDVFVFPSETETFGLAVLEAMASGVPVVAMANGGPKVFVEDDVSGLLARTVSDWTAAVLTLCCDDALRTRLGRGARLRAAEWSWDVVFEELYDTYGEMINLAETRAPGSQQSAHEQAD